MSGLRRHQIQVAFVVGLLVFPFVPFLSGYRHMAIQAAQFTIVAASLVMLTGWVGQISLGHAALVGIGAYGTGFASTALGLNFPLSLPVAVAAGAAVAAVLGVIALRVRGLYLAVATLIFSWAASEFLFRQDWVLNYSTVPDQQIGTPGTLFALDFASTTTFYYVVWAAAVAVLFALASLRDSKTGRAFFAVRGSEMAAASLGMDVLKYKALAFAVSGGLAGLAGNLLMSNARVVSADTFDFNQSLFFLAIAVVGGLSSLAGAVAASWVFAFMGEMFFRIEFLNAFLQLVSAALLAIVFRLYPGGLASLGSEIAGLADRAWRAVVRGAERRWDAVRAYVHELDEQVEVEPALAAVGGAEQDEGQPLAAVEEDTMEESAAGDEPDEEAEPVAATDEETQDEEAEDEEAEFEEAEPAVAGSPGLLRRLLLAPVAFVVHRLDARAERKGLTTEEPLDLSLDEPTPETPAPAQAAPGGDNVLPLRVDTGPSANGQPDETVAGEAEGGQDTAAATGTSSTWHKAVEQAARPRLDPTTRHERRPLIRAEDITVRFGGLTAVDDATLEVREGEIVGLIGPNGAGKTTLFNAIAGFNEPDEGRVYLYGQDVTPLVVHERAQLGLARTFQIIQLFPQLSVFENLLSATHLQNPTGFVQHLTVTPGSLSAEAAARERVRRVIDILDLHDVADTLVSNIPFGILRMVEVARALVTGARVIMLDEPASGLDETETDHLMDVLRVVNSLGATMLLIEHDVRMVTGVSDHIYVLNRGVLIADDTPEVIQDDPKVISAYLGEPAEKEPVS